MITMKCPLTWQLKPALRNNLPVGERIKRPITGDCCCTHCYYALAHRLRDDKINLNISLQWWNNPPWLERLEDYCLMLHCIYWGCMQFYACQSANGMQVLDALVLHLWNLFRTHHPLLEDGVWISVKPTGTLSFHWQQHPAGPQWVSGLSPNMAHS